MKKEDIEKHRTPKGGYTKQFLASVGISWPPQKGWKNKLETVKQSQRTSN